MLSTESVWSRRDTLDETISDRAYNLTIGAVLLWGFAMNALMVQYIDYKDVLSFMGGNILIFFALYFASVIVGTMIYTKSDNPAISFIGYNFLVLPLGLIVVASVGPLLEVSTDEWNPVSRAMSATAAITGIMMMLASTYPRFFASIQRGLFIGLIVGIIVEVVVIMFVGAESDSAHFMDWFFVLLFSGYIGFDWARAQALPKTLDNAVDCAAALYVDIVILFLRLLAIFSRNR